MKVQVFAQKEWAKTTQAWWYAWHGQPIHERLLSNFGVAVLSDSGAPLAFAYIYPAAGSELAWLGFIVRDPFASALTAGRALKLLISAAETAAKRLGYPILYAATDSPAIKKLLNKRGYQLGSQVQEYFKELP